MMPAAPSPAMIASIHRRVWGRSAIRDAEAMVPAITETGDGVEHVVEPWNVVGNDFEGGGNGKGEGPDFAPDPFRSGRDMEYAVPCREVYGEEGHEGPETAGGAQADACTPKKASISISPVTLFRHVLHKTLARVGKVMECLFQTHTIASALPGMELSKGSKNRLYLVTGRRKTYHVSSANVLNDCSI